MTRRKFSSSDRPGLLLTLGVSLLATLPSCEGAEVPSESWHVGVYMAADNNLDGAATSDLWEMLQAELPPNVRVTIFLDRSAQSASARGSVADLEDFTGAKILTLADQTLTVEEDLGEVDSLDPAQIAEFAGRISASPEARKALIFWDHGSASAYGRDDTDGTGPLAVEELAEAVRSASASDEGEKPFAFVGFDTCLLGSLAALRAVSDLTDVYAASAELEPGDGWDYRSFLTAFSDEALSAESLGVAATEGYRAYYEDNPQRRGGLAVTLAAFRTDLTEVDAAFAELEALTEELVKVDEDAREVHELASRALAGATAYGDDPARARRRVDFGDLLDALETGTADPELVEALDRLRAAFAELRLGFGAVKARNSQLGLSVSALRELIALTSEDPGRALLELILGEESRGTQLLRSLDTAEPEVTLTLEDLPETSQIDFAIISFGASDEVQLEEARVSLALAEGDGALVLSSFRVDGARGSATLGESLYGVPIAAMSFDGAEASALEELGSLLSAAGGFIVPLRYRDASIEADGQLLLDEGLEPLSIVVASDGGESSVHPFEELVAREDVELAPQLVLATSEGVDLERVTGRFRPASEVAVEPIDAAGLGPLELIGAATDVADRLGVLTVPLP